MTLCKISGLNFGNAVQSIVSINGEERTSCLTSDHSIITCSWCPGGSAKIIHNLIVEVNSLVSEPYSLQYKGINNIINNEEYY